MDQSSSPHPGGRHSIFKSRLKTSLFDNDYRKGWLNREQISFNLYINQSVKMTISGFIIHLSDCFLFFLCTSHFYLVKWPFYCIFLFHLTFNNPHAVNLSSQRLFLLSGFLFVKALLFFSLAVRDGMRLIQEVKTTLSIPPTAVKPILNRSHIQASHWPIWFVLTLIVINY